MPTTPAPKKKKSEEPAAPAKEEPKELPKASPPKSVADQKDIDESYDAGKVIKHQKDKEEGKEDDVKGVEKAAEPAPVPTKAEKEAIEKKKAEIA